MPLHRLFVGNIPAGTNEQDLRQEFGSYGPVRAIDLKSKANPLDASAPVDTFAFVNIELDERTLRQCLTEFRQQQYRGVYLNVSKARESFLDRLKREREEAEQAKQNAVALDPYRKSVPEKEEAPQELPALPTIAKEVASSSSESSSESEDEEPAPVRKPSIDPNRRQQPNKTEDDQLVRKWNQETYIEHGKLRIVPITGQVAEVIDQSKNRRKVPTNRDPDSKGQQADEKRKQGLSKITDAYEQQKLAIKAALTGDMTGKRNKIVFDDGEEDDGQPGKKSKLALFEDGEEDDGFRANFGLRRQLAENTVKGQRLFEMQTQFNGDSRFKLDERFLDDDSEIAGRRKKKALEKTNSQQQPQLGKAQNQERKKQLEILSKVMGKEIQDRSQFKTGSTDAGGPKTMQRFDPSATVKGNAERKVEKPEKKKLTEEQILEAKRAVRAEEEFQVTEDKFYQVSEGLNSAIGSSGTGFSLLAMFGASSKKSDDDDFEENEDDDEPNEDDNKLSFDDYDISEAEAVQNVPEEEPEIAPEETQITENAEAKKKKKKAGYLSRQGIWKETLFFLPNDARLEEGRKFFTEFVNPQSTAVDVKADRDEKVKDIRKIFKKRRMRETKIVNQMRAKRGLKLVKGKRK
ncbi:nucleolar protein 8-like [Uranotaenia lowii]|uniref:nucleolar protein 8-like n=1 Tax=Uranotaenia lowii TaxID=190385 RepID=UPI00247AC63A|nr:nucleolar protein 8-like [Uranotaenia lowii]